MLDGFKLCDCYDNLLSGEILTMTEAESIKLFDKIGHKKLHESSGWLSEFYDKQLVELKNNECHEFIRP